MDVFSELEDIGRILNQASFLATVRDEVRKVMREGYVVTDGKHQDGANEYDVVVRCGDDESNVERGLLSSMPEVRVTKIANGILGINKARRNTNGR